jgi:hypothetical protein
LALGLRGLARAVGGVVATCAIAMVAAVVALGASVVATTGAGSPSWKVTVGGANRLLYPGAEATMPYSVRNETSGTQRLHDTTTQLKVDSAGCSARWFRVASNKVPADVDVPPGASVDGSLVLDLDDAATGQDACQNIDVEVVVDAS